MKYEVIQRSKSKSGIELTTQLIRVPRYIVQYISSHRMLSVTICEDAISESKRRSNISQIISEIEGWSLKYTCKFEFFREELESDVEASQVPRLAANTACNIAGTLIRNSAPTETIYRVLSPYELVDVVVSATEWENFYASRLIYESGPYPDILEKVVMEMLRNHLQKDAAEIKEYHIPFDKIIDPFMDTMDKIEASAVLCYRGGKPLEPGESYKEIAKDLVNKRFFSPFEHPAFGLNSQSFVSNFKGWAQSRKKIPTENPVRANLLKIYEKKETERVFRDRSGPSVH